MPSDERFKEMNFAEFKQLSEDDKLDAIFFTVRDIRPLERRVDKVERVLWIGLGLVVGSLGQPWLMKFI